MVKKAALATPNLRLRAARKERGWTQQKVADRIGAPHSLNISRWENGTAFPSTYYLEQLCHLFGKSVRELGFSQLEGEMQDETTSDGELEQSPPQAGPRMWTVPYPRNLFFLEREEVLTRLQRQFLATQAMDLSQPQAISGLGGIGKTQVVLEYAYRHAQDYQAVFWVRADSRDTLVADFLEIARTMKLPEREERDQTIMVAAVKSWLSQHTDWLMILANADELTLLPEFLPAPLRGHLLLTTRAQALGRLAYHIEVHALGQDEAALLVLRRAGLLAFDTALAQAERADQRAAEDLSLQLGGLPLALDQAGAYLEETGCSLQHYLNLYKSHRADLLRRRGGLILDHPDLVVTTLSLSFASVEQQSALAADVLRVCSLLHPDAIPEELFLQGAVHLGPPLAATGADPLAFNNALSVIQSYSLLRRSSSEQTLSIHQLVQAVLADAMTKQERDLWTERTIAALNTVFPQVRGEGWEQWGRCGRLLPHVLTVVAASTPLAHSLELASLLLRTADYLLQRTQYEQAEPLYLRALHIREQSLGREHPQVAFPLGGLADLYQEQGNYQQAETLYLRALRLWEQAPTQEYPEVAFLLNNLAILYYEQGNHQRAEQLLQRALHLDEQMCGHEHRNTATRLNNLAVLYIEQGDHQRAEPLLQRVLRIDELALGPEHPDVAFPLINLADLYRKQGRYEQAEPIYLRALHLWEQKLGREHPQVAFPLTGLATLYREQGHYEQAEPLYQHALTIRHQQRGDQHPETAETLHELARLHELQNQPEQALFIRVRVLGLEHPHTVDTRTRYAHLLRVCGRTEEADALEAVPTKQAATGDDEPSRLLL